MALLFIEEEEKNSTLSRMGAAVGRTVSWYAVAG